MKVFVVLLLLVLLVSEAAVEAEQETLLDPRRNLSAFDIVVAGEGGAGAPIGGVREVLARRGLLDDSTPVSKYKLVFYSPELIPPELFLYQSTTPPVVEPEETTNSNATNSTTTSASSSSSGKFYDEAENIFAVDVTNGSVYLRTPPGEPPLEYLCLKRRYCLCFSCVFMLNVVYATENKVNAEAVRVFIDDHNDYAPRFPSLSTLPGGRFELNVSEASRPGEQFTLESAAARDDDAFYNRVVYYLTEDGSDERSALFDVLPSNTSADGLVLVLRAHLDFERRQFHDLQLVAVDNGQPQALRSSVPLRIAVVDENDNAPVCESSLVIASLREDAPGRHFAQIRASDLDAGANAALRYELETNTSLFTVDARTGWLSVASPAAALDYETQTWHELVVRVRDSPTDESRTFSVLCRARVNVLDANDNAAQMRIVRYLNESVAPDHYAMAETTTSTGSGESDQRPGFHYVGTEARSQVEVLENNRPELVLAMFRVFDRDSLSHYRFGVVSGSGAGDEETAGLFEVRETDRLNREFELVAKARFDAEKLQAYRLRVVLYDLDAEPETPGLMMPPTPTLTPREPEFRVNMFVRVRVLDLNDNRPRFSKRKYELTVRENEMQLLSSAAGAPLEANDLDVSELNSRLDYRIVDKNNVTADAARHFRVDYNASSYNYPALRLTAPLDYETDGGWYEFYLVAADRDGLADAALVSVRVEDVNDHAPVFVNANTTFVIRENMPANSFIGQVIALDRDAPGPNSDLAFRLLGGADEPLFRIYRSGVITSKVELDAERQSLYALRVEARDLGEPAALASTATFFVRVEDENDNAPLFVFPPERTRYLCLKAPVSNETAGGVLFEVKAVDRDAGDAGRLVYALEDSDDLLSIDSVSGAVSLVLTNVSADFRRILAVSLLAKDHGSPPLTSRLNLTLYLNYDASEMPEDVLRAMQEDLAGGDSEPVLVDLADVLQKGAGGRARGLFHTISSSVHVVILLIVLAFTVFMACLLVLAMFYKRAARSKAGRRVNDYDAGPTSASGQGQTGQEGKSRVELPSVSVSVSKSPAAELSFFKDSSMTASSSTSDETASQSLDGCVGQMKTCLAKARVFQEASGAAKGAQESLTVKDESSKLDSGGLLPRNSFRVTIKQSDTVPDFAAAESEAAKSAAGFNDLSKIGANESSANYNLSAKNLSLFVNNNTDSSQNSSSTISNNVSFNQATESDSQRFNLPTFEEFVSSSNMDFGANSFPFFAASAVVVEQETTQQESGVAAPVEPSVLTALYKETNEQLNFDYNANFNKYFENFYYDSGKNEDAAAAAVVGAAGVQDLNPAAAAAAAGLFSFDFGGTQDPANPLRGENRLSVFNELPNSSEVLQSLLNKFESFYHNGGGGGSAASSSAPNATAADLSSESATGTAGGKQSANSGEDTTEESTLASLAKFSSSGASQTNFAQC